MNESERRAIRWVSDHEDRIRSEDSTYWVTRAPVMGRMVYTAAYRPQDAKLLATHLGCHDSGAAAKQACEDHLAQQERRHGS